MIGLSSGSRLCCSAISLTRAASTTGKVGKLSTEGDAGEGGSLPPSAVTLELPSSSQVPVLTELTLELDIIGLESADSQVFAGSECTDSQVFTGSDIAADSQAFASLDHGQKC